MQARKRCLLGVEGRCVELLRRLREVRNHQSSRRTLERAAEEGESPVSERLVTSSQCSRVPRDTWNPVGIWVDHDPRLNTPLRPIVNQYREGKVKSTPVRGVKEYLKPCIYKQWKHYDLRVMCDRVPFA